MIPHEASGEFLLTMDENCLIIPTPEQVPVDESSIYVQNMVTEVLTNLLYFVVTDLFSVSLFMAVFAALEVALIAVLIYFATLWT